MARTNGGVIGPQNLPTTISANGVWSLAEIHPSRRGNIWPIERKGVTSANPAISAKEVYTAGSTTSGNYYINNIYTGNTTRLVYCRLNVDGLHYQKWNPSHLSGYQDNGTFGSTGTHTLGVGYNVDVDDSATSTGWSHSTGTSTNAGGSKTYDTGLEISTVNGHYWLYYHYISSVGGGGWASTLGVDWQATSNGTDYGNSYVADWGFVIRGDGSGSAGTHKLARGIWNSGGTATAEFVFSTSSYSDVWSKAGSWTANKTNAGPGASGTQTSAHYIGLRTSSWSDDGNNGTSYVAIWVHIP